MTTTRHVASRFDASCVDRWSVKTCTLLETPIAEDSCFNRSITLGLKDCDCEGLRTGASFDTVVA